MKILINAFSARQGGGQTYLINLLEHLPDSIDLELLVFAPASLKLPANDKIKRCATRWPTTNPIARALWERFFLPYYLAKNSVDILFCPGGTINTPVPKGCKTVTMFRNMIPFDMKVRQSLPFGLQILRNWLLERVMLKSMAAADLTIFISDFARGVIESRITLKSAVTIPHGINPAFRSYDDSFVRHPVVPSGKYILYVSKFDVYKHHYEVVKAYAGLSVKLRDEYKLLLVGENVGPEADRVTAFVQQNELHGQVRIVGVISYRDLPALYHHADVILFASSCENCPNILLEALGAGRPVLSSDVMPMPEFGGDAVGYFSPFDLASIRRAIDKVLADENYAKRLAAAAKLKSCKYDWAITANETWTSIFTLAK